MKKVIRLTEGDLHKIIKESVNRILSEDQEGYNQVMNTLNNPTAQKGLKKAWNKERKKNPNADYDTFEYNHALNLQNKKRKEDERYATVKESVKKIIREGFEDDFNAARDKHIGRGGLFGLEMKNSEGDWQYGDVTYDPNTNTMSCMGVSIQVDPDMSIDQNLEGLYDELINNGYTDGDDEDEEWPEERIEDRIDTEANMDDYPPMRESINRKKK